MTVIPLTPLDLSIAASLVIALGLVTSALRLGIAQGLIVSAARMTIQLLLIGFILEKLFAVESLLWVGVMALVMLLVAGREVTARHQRRLRGGWSYGVGTSAMLVSSFSVTILALTVMVDVDPWYKPQYAIPILGMLLGNTMTGVAIACDRLTTTAYENRAVIEERLLIGESAADALRESVRASIKSGLIPTINAMAAAGLVSLPGMMTGQILSGSPPAEAVKYQILIWLLIAAGTGFGMIVAVQLTARRLFDARDRLRLDRLHDPA